MKAVGVTGPDFILFDISEPIAAPDGVVVDVMAALLNGLYATKLGRRVRIRDV